MRRGIRGHSPCAGHSVLVHPCPLLSSLNGLNGMWVSFAVPSYLLLCPPRHLPVLGT